MTPEEAIRILGLKPGETVESYRQAFGEVQKHMERLRDEADSEEKRQNYDRELNRFREALEVATHHAPKKRRPFRILLTLFLCLAAVVGAMLGSSKLGENAARISAESELLAEGQEAVAARNWIEAEKIFNTILAASPTSEAAREGLKNVAEGREVEKKQQVGFLLGRAQALMELRRWEEAEEAIADAIAMDPEDEQLAALQSRMKEGRRRDEIERLVEEAELAQREQQWEELIEKTKALETIDPGHEKLPQLVKMRDEAQLILSGMREQANKLYEQALVLDQGSYSEEALELLREAQRLAPTQKAADLYEKMSGYVQTVRVPEDAETIAEALGRVRSGDKVRLGPQVFRESLLLPEGVVIEGTDGESVIESNAGDGSVIVVQGGEKPVRLVGLQIKHLGVSTVEERYPVVLIESGKAILEDCEVGYGSGHGIAVTGGGHCELLGTEVKACGWDGVAVTGSGSKAILRESRCLANFHHGLDVWDGGAVEVERSRFQDNGLVGILLSSEGGDSRIANSSLERNRELGMVISNGAVAELTGNRVAENILGGIFARDEGTRVSLVSNIIEKNGEAGLVIAKEVTLEKEEDNEVRSNVGKQKWLQADLATPIEERPILKALPVE